MTRWKVLVDPGTETGLGPVVLRELRASLRPVDCQTCGRPFERRFGRRESAALVVEVAGEDAVASLHHPGCRAAGRVDVGSPDGFTPLPHRTWRARLLKMTAHGRDELMFLVNPSYEVAGLSREAGRWRVSTLDTFAALGLGQELLDAVIPLPSLSAVIDEDRLSVHVGSGGTLLERWDLAGSSFTPDTAGILAAKDWLPIAVTTSLDVNEPIRRNPVRRLLDTRAVRLGAGRVRYTDAAQRLRTSDFADREQWEKLLALVAAVIKLGAGVTSDAAMKAAVASCHGDSRVASRLRGTDRMHAAALVALLYAAPKHGSIHLMAPDPAGAAAHHELFSELSTLSDTTAALLTEDPASERILTRYRADIVIGTPEQFRETHELHRNDAGDWGPDETRGYLALAIGTEAKQRAGELIERYPKVAVV